MGTGWETAVRKCFPPGTFLYSFIFESSSNKLKLETLFPIHYTRKLKETFHTVISKNAEKSAPPSPFPGAALKVPTAADSFLPLTSAELLVRLPAATGELLGKGVPKRLSPLEIMYLNDSKRL